MHLTDVSKGMMGSYAIIGAHLCVANGAAWSAQMRGTDQVAVAFFGDGTTNIGAFHEALNLAVVWELPVVFVCENNLYMEYTPIDVVTAVPNPAAGRAACLWPGADHGRRQRPDAVYLVASERVRRGARWWRTIADRSDHLPVMAAIRGPTPGSTAPPPRSKRGWSGTRSPCTTSACSASGPPRGDSARSSGTWRDAIDAATEFAKAGTGAG